MKERMMIGSMIVGLALAAAAPAGADTAIGQWKTETRNAIVEITHCGASICGRILTSDARRTQPDLRDTRNANAALRNRPIKGLQFISGFNRDGDAWSGGQIYNADDGKTYSAKVTPQGPNQLKVRGCVFVPFCKTQTWTRVR
jgi:uncharacterized protein (DUF2147 family)